MLEPGVLFADRYEVRSVLGQSPLSTVYKARDARLDQWVALKILNRDFQRKNQESSIRFRRDAGLLGELRHANVARLLDLGESDGAVFVAQEYFEGGLLRNWVRRRAGRPGAIPCILEILCQIADGLEGAHARGLLHRDIRTSNVLLVDPTAKPEEEPARGIQVCVRILDFGLARLVDYARFLTRGRGSRSGEA